MIEKNCIQLDNILVVSYNACLQKKYHAHINVEFCNQGRSIKHLLKYVNKGYEIMTFGFFQKKANGYFDENANEIKIYYDCQ